MAAAGRSARTAKGTGRTAPRVQSRSGRTFSTATALCVHQCRSTPCTEASRQPPATVSESTRISLRPAGSASSSGLRGAPDRPRVSIGVAPDPVPVSLQVRTSRKTPLRVSTRRSSSTRSAQSSIEWCVSTTSARSSQRLSAGRRTGVGTIRSMLRSTVSCSSSSSPGPPMERRPTGRRARIRASGSSSEAARGSRTGEPRRPVPSSAGFPAGSGREAGKILTAGCPSAGPPGTAAVSGAGGSAAGGGRPAKSPGVTAGAPGPAGSTRAASHRMSAAISSAPMPGRGPASSAPPARAARSSSITPWARSGAA